MQRNVIYDLTNSRTFRPILNKRIYVLDACVLWERCDMACLFNKCSRVNNVYIIITIIICLAETLGQSCYVITRCDRYRSTLMPVDCCYSVFEVSCFFVPFESKNENYQSFLIRSSKRTIALCPFHVVTAKVFRFRSRVREPQFTDKCEIYVYNSIKYDKAGG